MSGLELAGGALLAASYLDARWGIRKDMRLVGKLAGMKIENIIAERSGKVNLIYKIERHANQRPDHLAIVYPRPVPGKTSKDGDAAFQVESYTYRQLYDIIQKYAHVFKFKYGVKPNDVVAMDFVNKAEFLFVWYSLWSIGATPAFINYNLKDHSLVHCVRAGDAVMLIVDDEVAENVRPVETEISEKGPKPIRVVYADAAFYKDVELAPKYCSPTSERNPDHKMWNAAMLIYTSGTTGLPKAAVMSWAKAYIGSASYSFANEFNRNDVLYSAMPLYHSTASVLGALNMVYTGATYAVGHKFSTSSFWTQVRLTNATAIQYVGETCRYLLNAPSHPDERNHRLRLAAGNGLRPDVWVKFKERFNIPLIGEFYGATEFPTATTNLQKGAFAIGAVSNYGRFVQTAAGISRYTIVAVDPNNPTEIWRDPQTGFGRRTKVNEPGEFVFKIDGQRVHESFQGYTDKAATEKKILRDVLAKGDAYVRSGDLLRFDDDGLIFFVDRLGDTFRWKSENVSTNEVEEVLTSHEGIEQVVVVGVQVPNHEGRAGFAVIQPKDINKLPDLTSLAQHAIKCLPRYAVPVFLKFVPAIETTGNNKVQKGRYRDQKIPGENIFWLKGDKYVPLTHADWAPVTSGSARL